MVQRNSTQQARLRARVAKSKPSCWLCGEAIDYTLKSPDPKSFEIDHVIPLTPPHNGPDTIENVRAAHRGCNSKKRARLVAPIVRRSGSLS